MLTIRRNPVQRHPRVEISSHVPGSTAVYPFPREVVLTMFRGYRVDRGVELGDGYNLEREKSTPSPSSGLGIEWALRGGNDLKK